MQQYEPDQDLLSGYMRQRRSRRRWRRAAVVLSILAAAITMSLMTLPAITMEDSPEPLRCQLSLHQHTDGCYDADGALVCGYADLVVHTHTADCCQDGTLICPLEEIQAHTHTPECFGGQPVPVLTCELEEGGHAHDESCYTVREGAEPICGREESEGHTHGEGCYAPGEPVLTCSLAETEGHAHTDSCYQTQQVLICTDDSEEHVHTEGCYTVQSVLTCPLEESEGHIHGEACYTAGDQLVCTQTEAEGHVHSLDCYDQEDWVLSCGQQEGHIHTDACYALQQVPTCGREEIVLHTHDDGCFDDHGVLTCGLLEVTEHIHDASCFPPADEEEVQIPDSSPPAGDVPAEEPAESAAPDASQESAESADPDALPGESPEASQEPAESQPPEIVQSCTSWATAEKLPSGGPQTPGPPYAGQDIDLADHALTGAMEYDADGVWVPVSAGGTIGDGSGIRVTISYSLGAGVITSPDQALYYQPPAGVVLANAEQGYVMSGGEKAGTYTISADGLIVIRSYDTWIADGSAIAGSVQFQGTVSLADMGGGDQLDLCGTIVTVAEGEKPHDLSVTKTGTHTGGGTIAYTVTVSTETGTDGPITVADAFLHDTALVSVTYQADSFTVAGPDGTALDGYVPSFTDGASFTISGLPALAAGERYTITYTAAADVGRAQGGEDGSLEISSQVTAQAGGDSAGAQAVVTITIPHGQPAVEKAGILTDNGDGSTTIRYYVAVDPGGTDLAPSGDALTLTDTLTLSDPAAQADFLPETAALYAYDPDGPNCCGAPLSAPVFQVIPGEDGTVTFTIPDQTACVVVYDYVIRSGSAGGEISVTNTAQLSGAPPGQAARLAAADSAPGAVVAEATLTLTISGQTIGYVLPETGGTGTALWTAGGLGLIALAGLMYLIARRKGGEAR